jgi:hypothetical protein
MGGCIMSGNIRLYNTSGYVELQAPSSASAQVLELPTDSIKPALVHLHTETFSAVSTISIDECFTSNYKNYRIIVNANSNSGSADRLNLRMRSSGSDNSSNNYFCNFSELGDSSDTSVGVLRSVGAISQWYGGYIANPGYTSYEIYNPQSTQKTGFTMQSIFTGSTDMEMLSGSGLMSVTTSYDGFTLLAGSQSITGTVRVYGYRD